MTAGAGHRRAAEAIAQAAKALYPQAEVSCVDVLHDAPHWFHAGYAWSYLFLVRHASWVWKWSYRFLDWRPVFFCVQPFRRFWNCFIVRNFLKRLKALQPEVVVATHFLPADICGAGKQAGWLRGKVIVAVTDFHPHWFWLSGKPDAMIAAVPESAATMEARGVDSGRIHVLGIPINESFGAKKNTALLRQRFGLSDEKTTVLVTSGGTTVGQFKHVVEELLNLELILPGHLQLLVVCGEDDAARQRLMLRCQGSATPMQVFGFVDYMADLMGVSSLVVSKAGGLTISEALGSGLPLVLYHIIPGQEQMNAHYLSRQGAAVIAHHPKEVGIAVRRFIEEPDWASAMRSSAMGLARPHAASDIVSRILIPFLEQAKKR